MSDFNIHEMLRKANQAISKDPSNKEIFGIFTKIFNSLPETQLDAINYFINTMPEKDITLIVIKGHLLLEQQVRNIFLSNFENSAILEKSKFQISQIIILTEATFENNTSNEYLWKCIKKINKIRNDIAHNIEASGIEEKVEDLIRLYNHISYTKIKKDLTTEEKLKDCIVGLGAHLISLATHAMKNRQAKDKAKHFGSMFQNDYAKFDDKWQQAIETDYDKLNEQQLKEREELTEYKKCANDSFFKIWHLVDVTNSEYIYATYGALLAGRERAESLQGEELKQSIEGLKQQYADFVLEMNNHFKDEYDKLMGTTIDNLKVTLEKDLKRDLKL